MTRTATSSLFFLSKKIIKETLNPKPNFSSINPKDGETGNVLMATMHGKGSVGDCETGKKAKMTSDDAGGKSVSEKSQVHGKSVSKKSNGPHLERDQSSGQTHTHTHKLPTYSLTHPYIYTLSLVAHIPIRPNYYYTCCTSYLALAYQLSTMLISGLC